MKEKIAKWIKEDQGEKSVLRVRVNRIISRSFFTSAVKALIC